MYPEHIVEKYAYGTDAAINGPGPSIEYYGHPIYFKALGLIIAYKMSSL